MKKDRPRSRASVVEMSRALPASNVPANIQVFDVDIADASATAYAGSQPHRRQRQR